MATAHVSIRATYDIESDSLHLFTRAWTFTIEDGEPVEHEYHSVHVERIFGTYIEPCAVVRGTLEPSLRRWLTAIDALTPF